jgi:hypothetical protein
MGAPLGDAWQCSSIQDIDQADVDGLTQEIIAQQSRSRLLQQQGHLQWWVSGRLFCLGWR